MSVNNPTPTYADPVVVDERTGKAKFNPIWLRWFLDLTKSLSASGAADHEQLSGLLGGAASQHYHLTQAQLAALVALLPTTIAAGTYTPTLTNATNLTASTAYQCQYIRIGRVGVVGGRVNADPTAAGDTRLGISLPVPSNFGALEDCGGVACAPGVAGVVAACTADAANDRIELRWQAVDLTNQPLYFIAIYEII